MPSQIGIALSGIQNSQFDPDAIAFLGAAGLTDTTTRYAINNLVTGLKIKGLWTKMQAIYPIAGSTSTTQKWNLKDPRDLDAAFRLTFSGGWTHSSSGALANGTNAYADTYYNVSSNMSLTSAHASIYQRIDYVVSGTNPIDMGGFDDGGTNQGFFIATEISNNLSRARMFNTAMDYASQDNKGFYLVTTDASTSRYYRNASELATAAASGSLPNKKVVIGNLSIGSSYWAPGSYAFASLGSYLDSTDVTNLNTIIQNYQTTLSRNV